MNKSDLIKLVDERAEITQVRAELAVDAVFIEIAKALVSGKEVAIHGFGTFAVKPTKARSGTNPRTGERLTIPAGKRVKFKPSKTLKDHVQ